MKAAILLTGKEARLRKLYELGDFVLDGEEEEYDDGLWIWTPGEYAEWYSGSEYLHEYLDEFIHKLNRKAGIKE